MTRKNRFGVLCDVIGEVVGCQLCYGNRALYIGCVIIVADELSRIC